MSNPLDYENPRHQPSPKPRCWFGLFSYLTFAATLALIIFSCGGIGLLAEGKP